MPYLACALLLSIWLEVIQLTVGMIKDEKIHKRGGNDE
jgi:hypothetical protein